MGYTHYFNHSKVTDKTWNKILKDCKKLYKNMPGYTNSAGGYYFEKPLQLAGWDGTGEPEFNRDTIRFNGKGPELDHETFCLKRKGSGDFCKTARKPYDLMVCACLLVYQYHSPNTISLGSDGNQEDWKESKQFISDILGVE
jgi:hypothetical protein